MKAAIEVHNTIDFVQYLVWKFIFGNSVDFYTTKRSHLGELVAYL